MSDPTKKELDRGSLEDHRTVIRKLLFVLMKEDHTKSDVGALWGADVCGSLAHVDMNGFINPANPPYWPCPAVEEIEKAKFLLEIQ